MSYAPSQSASASTTKTRHLQELARQLKELAERTDTLKQLAGQTAIHAEWMRQLGGDHAAWYVACRSFSVAALCPSRGRACVG